jgi:hypothetical protein
MALRTAAMGLSPAKNLRAVSFRICWLSLSPNCMVVLLYSIQPQNNLFTAKVAKDRKEKAHIKSSNFLRPLVSFLS